MYFMSSCTFCQDQSRVYISARKLFRSKRHKFDSMTDTNELAHLLDQPVNIMGTLGLLMSKPMTFLDFKTGPSFKLRRAIYIHVHVL